MTFGYAPRSVRNDKDEGHVETNHCTKQPAVLELAPGTFYWCRCGKSAKQPFSDGAHKGTDFVPMELTIAEKQKVALCQCKQTANQPSCDGTHKNL